MCFVDSISCAVFRSIGFVVKVKPSSASRSLVSSFVLDVLETGACFKGADTLADVFLQGRLLPLFFGTGGGFNGMAVLLREQPLCFLRGGGLTTVGERRLTTGKRAGAAKTGFALWVERRSSGLDWGI